LYSTYQKGSEGDDISNHERSEPTLDYYVLIDPQEMFPDIRYQVFQDDVGLRLSDLALVTWASALGSNDSGRARFGSFVDR
jgi:hypothetical protein